MPPQEINTFGLGSDPFQSPPLFGILLLFQQPG
jgi:hypothetical protein